MRDLSSRQDSSHDAGQLKRGWRRAVTTTHMRIIGTGGEGDHYPWKVYVNQITGERTFPVSR